MAHPAFWPTKSFFYPVGNTSPISLTQSLPPESDSTILLLGCGDPRNILYTLYSNSSNVLSAGRKYDITCCDIEPAILARNILLFTLVIGEEYITNNAQIWNIFYHFFLDDKSNALLISQSRKLAALSADMETWSACEYSSFLRVSSRLTLSELNRLWTLYAASGAFTAGRQKQFKATFVAEMRRVSAKYGQGNVLTGARAAGPLYIEAPKLCAEAHHRYWQTGVTFEQQKEVAAASLVNPTFAYTATNEGFVPHYATCPIPAFHLAPAFALLQSSDSRMPCRTIFELFDVAKKQFFAWCDVFRECCRAPDRRVVIRVLVGDVLATCHTLRAYAECVFLTAGERVSPWASSWLSLDGDYANTTDCPPPRQFNVIDTSNLVDHIGLLNILIATAPLLSREPTATLFTETLLSRGEDPLKSFTERLCCDPSTLFVLLDLVPSNFIFGFTTQSNIHEIIGHTLVEGSSQQYHERMVWKTLSLAQGSRQASPIAFDAAPLTRLLLHIYLQMFSHENVAGTLQRASLTDLRDRSIVRYSRRAFALFVRCLYDKIATDWSQVLQRLLDLIGDNRELIVGMNFYQDLLCHLHLLGLYTSSAWLPGSPFMERNRDVGRFRRWHTVPSVVCVVISVPRQKLQILEDEQRVQTPLLQVQVLSEMFANGFTFVQIAFGTISITGENEDAKITITEDERGKQGKSPAICMVWVPAWVLCTNPLASTVMLSLVPTPANIGLFRQLGLQLELYSAPLMDAGKVHIVTKAPLTIMDKKLGLHAPDQDVKKKVPGPLNSSNVSISLDTNCRRIQSLTSHLDVTEPGARAELSKPETKVAVTPVDGCAVELSVGSHHKRRLFFLPIANTLKTNLRVARKSSWIEVIAPVPESPSFLLQYHPLACRGGVVNLWNVHYVDLNCLPPVRIDRTDKLSWLNPHVSLAFSDEERAQRARQQGMKALTQVKDSMHVIITGYAGVQSAQSNVFALNRTSNGGIDTLIFVTHLRLDLPAHTVILDTFVLPLEVSILEKVSHGLQRLQDSARGFISVIVSDEELVAWKHLLPAFTERCRTWRHKEDCAYMRKGMIPLSTDHGRIPICECGRGIVTDAFKAQPEWSTFAPFVTRAAISPLFALSWLDSVGQIIKDVVKNPLDEASPSIQKNSLEDTLKCAKCDILSTLEMAHAAFWPAKSFFYPVGNTSPICLSQGLPPEADATILLLGCGDPRSILYTIYSNGGDSPNHRRKYDITCSDIEPAILARNILLFTLITDDEYPKHIAHIWNIFYHFFLDEASNALLLTQCRKLVTLSASMDTWNSSAYSAFLRVSSRFTLFELNRLWTLYAATGTFTAKRKKQFREGFVSEMKNIARQHGTSNVTTGTRSAGPLYFDAMTLTGEAHERFWQTGTTLEEQSDSTSIVNPTFAYTANNEGFLAHYGTCILSAFHLAPAFACLDAPGSPRPCRTIFDLFRLVQSQFRQWCEAFRAYRRGRPDGIIMRFLVGDVFAVAYTLQAYAESGALTAYECTNPWKMSWITLGSDYIPHGNCPPPRRFSVIDTSNLADHMDMLNILVATAPLLSRDAPATLLTETLLSVGKDPSMSFTDRLCCDPKTLFLLLDLVPCSYLSGFTTQSNVHEVLTYTMAPLPGISSQYHERIVWKRLSSVHADQPLSIRFDVNQLSGLLHDVYLGMFSHEDKSALFRNMSLSLVRDQSVVHYCRRSYALLLRYLSERIIVDWDKVMDKLLEHIRDSPQLLVGMNYYQELLSHLHLLGLVDDNSWPWNDLFTPINRRAGRFRQWGSVPSVVCVVLPIPRHYLRVLDDFKKAPNSPVHAQIWGDMYCNGFSCVQISFGTVSLKGTNEDAEVLVAEDDRGKQGDSPAIVAFWAPVWVLCLAPLQSSVVFGPFSTLGNTALISELGLQMKLYSAPLMDESKVFISRKAPITVTDDKEHLRAPDYGLNKRTQVPPQSPFFTVILNSSGRAASLMQHIDVTDPTRRAALSQRETNVTAMPVGPASVDLSIGGMFERRLDFPPIVDISEPKLRVARTSSWIEVVVFVSPVDVFPLQNFSLTHYKGTACSWTIHYLNPDHLPSLRMDAVNDGRKWLGLHMSLTFSDREVARKVRGQEPRTMSQVKESIHSMIVGYAGLGARQTNVFALDRKSKGGIDTLIFVTHLRFDLPAHTLVLDAFILPLTPDIRDRIHSGFRTLFAAPLVSVVVSEEELVVWKHLLPALTERCRTWKHKKDCAYTQKGKIPLSTEHGEVPICACGRGIVTDAFKAQKEWAVFTPYVTRAAISPLFALSYLDSVGQMFSSIARNVSDPPPSPAKNAMAVRWSITAEETVKLLIGSCTSRRVEKPLILLMSCLTLYYQHVGE
ncbi:hypothetical protein NM688_g1321 [Phlebia brevispora]|uniref:Uncharacterized protein n=1 Tax=Phlebia brevispora TaxID=194682 RepID=A0ACC1TBN9_9APHY|nr:hypothetical protein NM688_g1321 [Phlebia brevispora]